MVVKDTTENSLGKLLKQGAHAKTNSQSKGKFALTCQIDYDWFPMDFLISSFFDTKSRNC